MIALGILSAVIALGLVWLDSRSWPAERAAADLNSNWGADCGRGPIRPNDDGELVLEVRRGAPCDIAVSMINSSDRPVHVARIETPAFGPGTGGSARAVSTTHAKLRKTTSMEAVWDVDVTIPAHSDRAVHVAVAWNEAGCTEGVIFVKQWPEIVVEVSGHEASTTGQETLFVHAEDTPAATGCA